MAVAHTFTLGNVTSPEILLFETSWPAAYGQSRKDRAMRLADHTDDSVCMSETGCLQDPLDESVPWVWLESEH